MSTGRIVKYFSAAALAGGAIGIGTTSEGKEAASVALDWMAGGKQAAFDAIDWIAEATDMRSRPPQAGDSWGGCDDARAAGTAPIYRGEPGYREGMDGDGDGIACEPYY